MKRRAAMLLKYGVSIPRNARILDFGCGSGGTVASLLEQGFCNVFGYDVKDRLKLGGASERSRFFISDPTNKRLPFEDNTFDLVISEQVLEHVMDQVGVLRELRRVMKPGGCALHVFPARYSLLEPHMFVPLGGVFVHRWWYKIWAVLGIRNEFQKTYSADETADRNAFYSVSSLNYVSNSCYESIWHQLGYQYFWIDQENFDTSGRFLVRLIGKCNRFLRLPGWLNRTFHTRRVLLIKSLSTSLGDEIHG